MKRRKRHTLLKFIILAVIAGGVVQYSGVLKDTDVFPEKITNQISVEQCESRNIFRYGRGTDGKEYRDKHGK